MPHSQAQFFLFDMCSFFVIALLHFSLKVYDNNEKDEDDNNNDGDDMKHFGVAYYFIKNLNEAC